MKSFLNKIVLFAGLLILINALLYVFGHQLYFGEYRKYSLEHTNYLFADSHGLPLQNCTEEFGVYNFSAGSDSYFDIHRKLNFLLRHTRIDTVYVSVDDHTLGEYRDRMNNRDRSAYYSVPAEYTTYYEYFKNKYLVQYLPILQPATRTVIRSFVFGKVRKLFWRNDSNLKSRNWDDLDDVDQSTTARSRAETQFVGNKPSPALRSTLEQIISMARAHNVTLVGVRFPVSERYAAIIDDRSYGAHELFKAYDLPVLDYRDVYTNQDSVFRDQDHLTYLAGCEFARTLLQNK